MKLWPFSLFQKQDISQMPCIPIGRNGSYGLNPANKKVSQNILSSLKEMEDIPVQRYKKK